MPTLSLYLSQHVFKLSNLRVHTAVAAMATEHYDYLSESSEDSTRLQN